MHGENVEIPISNDMTDLQTDFENDLFDFINPSQEQISQTQTAGFLEHSTITKTTKRTGLTEDQLKNLSPQISVNEVTNRKRKIDEALDKLKKTKGNDNFLNMWLLKQTDIEEKRLMREEQREAENAKKGRR